jgi:hypothetical protein
MFTHHPTILNWVLGSSIAEATILHSSEQHSPPRQEGGGLRIMTHISSHFTYRNTNTAWQPAPLTSLNSTGQAIAILEAWQKLGGRVVKLLWLGALLEGQASQPLSCLALLLTRLR